MGYRKIKNLYKDKCILAFKEAFAMEKIHGTSAHIRYKDGKISFYSGGVPHQQFVDLFVERELTELFERHGCTSLCLYGEAYGGKCQGMSHTYGPDLKFIVFEVAEHDKFFSVEAAHEIAKSFGLDFVPYERIETTIEAINQERDRPSVQAVKNGITEPHLREGIVLRPIDEFFDARENRIICKHKGEAFSERLHQPKVIDPEQQRILEVASEVAKEWVTDMRFDHVWDKLKAQQPQMEYDMVWAKMVGTTMVKDVYTEAKGEIVESKSVQSAIMKAAINILKRKVQERVNE